ncbi:hypothetical protein C2S52_021008 [Perilla frutescens var. hirtella]|nr:hypothetical protein C2S52_021008 [Perilla frutescens var. hirtella]
MPSFKLKCDYLMNNEFHHLEINAASNSRLATSKLETTLLSLICSPDNSSNIKTNYDLKCCFHNASSVERCISYIGKSGVVEELNLYLNCCPGRRNCPFSCRLLSELPPSLKYFSLGVCTLQPYKFKTTKCSSLQTLELTHVVLDQPSMDCILSSCFNLVSLLVSRSCCPKKLCIRGDTATLNLHELKLNTLTISWCCDLEEMEFFAPNLTTLDIANSKIKIHKLGFDYLHKDLPRLKWLNFHIILTDGFNHDQEVKFLNLFQTFTHLRRLDIKVFCRKEISLLVLAPFLESFPLLEEFHLHIKRSKNDMVKVERKPQPLVLHRKLKKLEISGFSGTDNEIEFASYILNSAVALEQMFIIRCELYFEQYQKKWMEFTTDPWSEDTRKMIQERLMQHQAHSSCTAHLIIQHHSSFISA